MNQLPHLVHELPVLDESERKASVESLYRLGFIAESEEHIDRAAALFYEIVQREPGDPYAMLDLARMLLRLFEFEAARPLLERASKRAVHDLELLTQVGLVCQEARQDAEAERCFLLARRHAGGNLLASATLISFYEQRGRIPEAQAALDRVGRKALGNGVITALDGMVKLRSGEPANAVTTLRKSLSQLTAHHPYQVHARYALAKALSMSGETAAAVQNLADAKAFQRAEPNVERQRSTARLIEEFRAQAREDLEQRDVREEWLAEAPSSTRQPVFLLGYPRSGTTLLEQMITAHPHVSGFEETGAFVQALRGLVNRPLTDGENLWGLINSPDPSARQRARERYHTYLRLLNPALPADTLCLDKNPGLTGHIHLIARLFPRAPLIYMMRDPRDVCLSAYQTLAPINPFSVHWLDWGETLRHFTHITSHGLDMRERIPNPCLEVRYEDLVNNPAQTGARVMEFLGLDWHTEQINTAEHAAKTRVYSPSLYEVRRAISNTPVGKWQRFADLLPCNETSFADITNRLGY